LKKAASGFWLPKAWALNIRRASVADTAFPLSLRSRNHAWVTRAISAGIVNPKRRSSGSTVFDMMVVATSVVTIFMRSPHSTSTLSNWPDAIL
jgi:hypothetical protein